jgi:hypothetical protein
VGVTGFGDSGICASSSFIRLARHSGLSDLIVSSKNQNNGNQLTQKLQSSVLPGPRYGPVGGSRLKSELFNRYVFVGISEVFGHNHADLQSVTPALAHDHSVNYSTAQRPKRRGFKFEKIREKDATASRKKRLGFMLRSSSAGQPSSANPIPVSSGRMDDGCPKTATLHACIRPYLATIAAPMALLSLAF